MTFAEDLMNLVVSGVGGQGNILMARVIGGVLLKKGYFVTIADDIGVSQRAGAVCSTIRFSKKRRYGPMIPQGHAHFILGLEPLETLRMLSKYGNPKVCSLSNIKPINPAGVVLGRDKYPDIRKLKDVITELSEIAWFVDATDIALKLGAVIVTNVVMLGALAATKQLPIFQQNIEDELREIFPLERIELNLKALELGFNAMEKKVSGIHIAGGNTASRVE